jgi:phosphoenolpyruvate carboxykinase (ATP)
MMSNAEIYGLEEYGIKNVGNVYRNLPTPALYEQIVRRREGLISHLGPIVVRTGHHTGRSPQDKFIVKEESSEGKVWWGKENRPFDITRFNSLYHRLLAYLQGKDIYIQDCYAGADLKYRVPIRIITEYAWHSLFARNMFLRIKDDKELAEHKPEFTIFGMPRFHATPEVDGTNSEAFIIVDFGRKLILIGGTSYAGEIKKAVFTVLNYLLPQEEVLSMHCAANMGDSNDVALFFGLSGTGKTTLSTDINRSLLGDDEHGWGTEGIFNFEGGCYAKVIKISLENEPQIYECTRKFGTILENVYIDGKTRRLNMDDAGLTENTRASYPITHIDNSVRSGMVGHPRHIFMLSCDMLGIMPPMAMLTPEQAAYYFLQGYTARVAGTEVGMGDKPVTVFSPCFGAPFLALPPMKYTKLLLDSIKRHDVKCWLVNTGWVRGGYGRGKRIPLPYTRNIISSAIKGDLLTCSMSKDPNFGFMVIKECSGVPYEILSPENGWDSIDEYHEAAKMLKNKFTENINSMGKDIPKEILNAVQII